MSTTATETHPAPVGAAPTGALTPWLTTAEAALIMRVSVATVLRHAKSGSLPHRRVGSQYRFVQAELEAWEGTPATGRGPVSPVGQDWSAQLAAVNPYAA